MKTLTYIPAFADVIKEALQKTLEEVGVEYFVEALCGRE